ncbi:MAG: 3-phosphoglycerate dehydrogenase, partial [Prolixibacteraceae bacterium]|nr:3-phosphoglycerate dehydrogenase [Prolixibacteraceae bacterium]
MRKILIATEKPFAPAALKKINKIFKNQDYRVQLLESYTSKAELLTAVSEVDAAIIRSDKFDTDVFEAARKLKIVVRA